MLYGVLNSVHHANRQSPDDRRLAVALPGLHLRRDMACPGHEVVVFGDEEMLSKFLELDGIVQLVRRGVINAPDIMEAFAEPGEPGTAWLRDRRAARRSPGAVRRARDRAARRGKPMPERIELHQPDRRVLTLNYGRAVVHVRMVEADITNAPLMVGTYGFSMSRSPALLPIRPDHASA